MAIPTLVSSNYQAAQTSTSVQLTGASIGDLLVIIMSCAADGGLTQVPTVTDGASTSMGSATLDKMVNGTGGDSAKRVAIWSLVLPENNGTINISLSNWPSTGNRRYGAVLVHAVGGYWQSTVERVGPASGIGVDTTGLSSGQWRTVLGAATTSDLATFAISVDYGNNGAATSDFNDDGTFNTSPDPTSSDSPPQPWMDLSTHTIMSAFTRNAANPFKSVTGFRRSVGSGVVKAAAAALYIYKQPPEGRGDAASAAGGYGLVGRAGHGRANAASAAGGYGYIYTADHTGYGLSASASAATGAGTKTVYGYGLSATVSDSFSYAWNVSHPSHGRANIASAAGGYGTVSRKGFGLSASASGAGGYGYAQAGKFAHGRSNSASAAGGYGRVSVGQEGRSRAASAAYGHGAHTTPGADQLSGAIVVVSSSNV